MSKKRTPIYSTIRFKKEIADQIRKIAAEDGRKVEIAAERLVEAGIKNWTIKKEVAKNDGEKDE